VPWQSQPLYGQSVIVKLALFTGLRIEEVLTIPADCLVWDEHLDIVTGRPAGTVAASHAPCDCTITPRSTSTAPQICLLRHTSMCPRCSKMLWSQRSLRW